MVRRPPPVRPASSEALPLPSVPRFPRWASSRGSQSELQLHTCVCVCASLAHTAERSTFCSIQLKAHADNKHEKSTFDECFPPAELTAAREKAKAAKK
jgi:hypothetical protein